ncbi:MAG TPA: class I SAM-dependent methyltransferase, partial [Kofleriaceae bacterium]|nr:class I SAM-dependent methyltransferase [Kofleriaceae bacterium]
MSHEFASQGFFKDRLICYSHDLKRAAIQLVKRVAGKPARTPHIASRISSRRAKELLLREKLAVSGGAPSWFYTAFERGDSDPLTNYTLSFIESSVARDARILVTGCGTGIMVFHLADCGFRELVGFDLLPEAITIANRLREEWRYTQTTFRVENGFAPELDGQFDVITAMHWVFSAWAGNYGNNALPIEQARDPAVRERLLGELLAAYAPHLARGGYFIVELTDAVTDYRLASDHRLGEPSTQFYPVRHT